MARRSGERAINGRMPMEPTTSSRSEVVSEQAIAMFLRLRWFCHLALTWDVHHGSTICLSKKTPIRNSSPSRKRQE